MYFCFSVAQLESTSGRINDPIQDSVHKIIAMLWLWVGLLFGVTNGSDDQRLLSVRELQCDVIIECFTE